MELSGGRQQSGLAAGGMKRGWRGVSATSDAAQNSKRPAMAAGRSSELSLSSFRDYTSSVPSLVAMSQVPMRKYPQCSNLEKSNWEADAFLPFTKSASI